MDDPEYDTLRAIADWLEELDPDHTPIPIDRWADRTPPPPQSLTDPMDLRRIRLDLGVTVQALAHATGIHRDTIRRIENHRHTPTAPTLERLAAGLRFLTGADIWFDTDGLHPVVLGASETSRTQRADPLGAHRMMTRRPSAG